MTKTHQDRGHVPSVDETQDEGGEPFRPIRDPLAWMSGQAGEDPSLIELVAFRDSRPDLKAFAREAKRCDDEADRAAYGLDETQENKLARVGLKIVGLSCTAIVAIWPTDTIDDADAKQGLARETRMHGDDTAYGVAAMLTAETAARIRLHRAAFAVGEGIVPPAPPPPAPAARGLADWPLSRFDLVDLVPREGGKMTLTDAQVARWASFTAAYPQISDCVERFARMIAIADRLDLLAAHQTADASDLRRGAEAARIIAYLAAARAAIWPAMLHSADAEAKLRLVTCINDRACRGDPLHQQAAIRHVVTEANWIAMAFRFGATLQLHPDWIPIV